MRPRTQVLRERLFVGRRGKIVKDRPFMSAEQAKARLTWDEVREMDAYTMGVQALVWGFQFIKIGLYVGALFLDSCNAFGTEEGFYFWVDFL